MGEGAGAGHGHGLPAPTPSTAAKAWGNTWHGHSHGEPASGSPPPAKGSPSRCCAGGRGLSTQHCSPGTPIPVSCACSPPTAPQEHPPHRCGPWAAGCWGGWVRKPPGSRVTPHPPSPCPLWDAHMAHCSFSFLMEPYSACGEKSGVSWAAGLGSGELHRAEGALKVSAPPGPSVLAAALLSWQQCC